MMRLQGNFMGLTTLLKPPIADLYITGELLRRTPKARDPLREKLALQDLANRMAEHPEQILPRFVDLAMEITAGASAGLSLLEPFPEPGVFRWKYLRGLLSPFEGATTPRNFSPCGVTLDQNGPVLSQHPERFYDWISDADIVAPEVLLVPLTIGGDLPLGTLWIVSETEGHFDSGHARAMTELAAFVGVALRMLRTERELQEALIEQETLASEMSHRVKNLFAMTDGLIRISAKNASTKDEFVRSLSGRLHALASAHALVRRNLSEAQPNPRASDLAALIFEVVDPYEHHAGDRLPRFSLEGPVVRCGDNAMNGVALIIHELATNAAKYGALTEDAGEVQVRWRQDGDRLVIRWAEVGGPPIPGAPEKSGFGSTLVRNTARGQFGGSVDYSWEPGGLIVTLDLQMDRVTA